MDRAELESCRVMLVERVPLTSAWRVRDVVLEWSFERAASPLNTLKASDVVGGDVLPSWRGIYLLGAQRYAQGGGAEPFIGLEEATGRVVSLDVECGEAASIQLVNSGVEQFVNTFCVFESVLGQGGSLTEEVMSQARRIDPESFSESMWASLSEYVLG